MKIPEQEDVVIYLDEDGEPTLLFTRVQELLVSYVTPQGKMVFEILAEDGDKFLIIQANPKEWPYKEWVEYIA